MSPACRNKLDWLISKIILGEGHAFELKLMVDMDALMPSRRSKAERYDGCTLYWNRGGVRALTIADNINADVSSVFGIRSNDNGGIAHS